MALLKAVGIIVLILGIYALMSDDDYHKTFDNSKETSYNNTSTTKGKLC